MTRKIMSTHDKLEIMSSPAMQRMLKVYRFAFFEVAILFVIAFSQTIYKKIVYGVWEQHGLILERSWGLDMHVLTAVIFVLLFLSQVMFGIFQGKNQTFVKFHINLGRFLVVFTFIFLPMAIWAVKARSFNTFSIESAFYMDVVFIAIFVIKGVIAIKQKRYFDHIDSMLGAFMVAARSAMFRVTYVGLVAIYGYAPMKLGTTTFVVNLMLYSNMFLFYFLAGRWKENRVMVLSQVTISSVLLIVIIYLNRPIAHLFFY